MEFKFIITTYLPWCLSIITIYQAVLTGNKNKNAWLIGGANQALWLFWIIVSESYGFLPMNIVLWIVFTRNHLKWVKEFDNPVIPEESVIEELVIKKYKESDFTATNLQVACIMGTNGTPSQKEDAREFLSHFLNRI